MAQKTREQLKIDSGGVYTTNSTGDILAEKVRPFNVDWLDSFAQFDEVDNKISAHNNSNVAHDDMRDAIAEADSKATAALGGVVYLTAHDFGSAEPSQQDITDYALSQPHISELTVGLTVVNLFDNNEWRYQIISDSDPVEYEWKNIGQATVKTATNNTLGIVMGGDGKISVDSNGRLFIENNSINDILIGERTITNVSTVEPLLTGNLTDLLSNLSGRIQNLKDVVNGVSGYMYFAPDNIGTGDGSSWANAKRFSSTNYNEMASETAALLLYGKYVIDSTINVVDKKPVFGGFLGIGLEKGESKIIRPFETWNDVVFSKYSTIIDGSGNKQGFQVTNGYVDNIVVGNCYSSVVGSSLKNGACFFLNGSTINNCTVANSNVINGGGNSQNICGIVYADDSSNIINCCAACCTGRLNGQGSGAVFYARNNSSIYNCKIEFSSSGSSLFYGFFTEFNSYMDNCSGFDWSTSDASGYNAMFHNSSNCVCINCYSKMSRTIAYINFGLMFNCKSEFCSSNVNYAHFYCLGGSTQYCVAKYSTDNKTCGFYANTNSVIVDCIAINCEGDAGGGFKIYGQCSRCSAYNCGSNSPSANNAGGGGFYVSHDSTSSLSNSKAVNCYANKGGGFYVSNDLENRITNCASICNFAPISPVSNSGLSNITVMWGNTNDQTTYNKSNLDKSDLIFTQDNLTKSDKFVCTVNQSSTLTFSSAIPLIGVQYIFVIKNSGASTITITRPLVANVDSINANTFDISAGREKELSMWFDGTKRRWLVSEEM